MLFLTFVSIAYGSSATSIPATSIPTSSVALTTTTVNPIPCEMRFSKLACTGNSLDEFGSVCMWDAADFKCGTVEQGAFGVKQEDLCAQHATQADCAAQTGCFFNLVEFECEDIKFLPVIPGITGTSTGTSVTGTTATGTSVT